MANNIKLKSITEFIEDQQNKDNPYLNGSYQEDYAKAVDPNKNDKILWAAAEGVKQYSVLNELSEIQKELTQSGLDGYLQKTSENEFKLIVVKRDTKIEDVVGQDGRLKADKEGELYQTALTMKTAHDIKGGMGGVNLGLSSLNNRVPTIAGGNGRLSKNGYSHFTFVNVQEGLLKGFLETLPNLVKYYTSKVKNPLLGVSAAGGIAADNVYMTSIAGVKKQDNPATSGTSGENAFIDTIRRERFNLKLLASELYPIIEDTSDKAALSNLIAAMSEIGLANVKIENREYKEGDVEFGNLYDKIINNYPSLFGENRKYIGALQPIFRDIYNLGWRNNMSGTSEEAFGKAIGDMGSRALVPGGNAMTYSLRNQNIGIQHLVTDEMREVMVPGVFTTKRATASGLKYAAPIPKQGDEDQIAPYDAGVPVIFLTDAQLAEAAPDPYKNATARDGQAIVTNEMANMLNTSFIKHDETISAKEIDDFIESQQKKLNSSIKRQQKKLNILNDQLAKLKPKTKKWKKLKKEINDLEKNISDKQKKAITNRLEVAEDLYDAKIALKKWQRVSSPNFTETENGGYIVSADKVVTGFNSGERGVGGNGERSAIFVGSDKLFSDTKIKDKNGNERSLSDIGIQVIMSPEQQDARKTMQFTMTQLDYAFRDMVKLQKMKEFWGRIKQDYENPKTEEVKKVAKGLKFLLSIATPNTDYSNYDLEDSAEVYRELYQEFDDTTVNYLIDYVDTLRDEFGGNMGFGKGFKLDDKGNLLYSGNPIVGYTSLKKDINDRYEGMDYSGSSLSTGATSLKNLLRMVSVNLLGWDSRKVNDVVDSIVKQIEPPEGNVEELQKRQADFAAAMNKMQAGEKQNIHSFTQEKGYITVGRGFEYDIDLDEIEPEEREGAVVTNEEKTLTYRANKKIQDLAQRYSIDPSQFKLVINPGDNVNVEEFQTFNGETEYGYGSNLLFLPANVTNWEGVQGDLNRKLVNALKNEDLVKRAQALSEVVRLLWRDVYNKDGPDFKRLMKVDAPFSFTMHSVGINPHGILTKENYESTSTSEYQKKVSDISSFGYRVSPKTLKKIYEIAVEKRKKEKKSKGKKNEGKKNEEKKNEEKKNEGKKRRPITEKELRDAVKMLGIYKPEDIDTAEIDQLIDWMVKAQTVGSQDFKTALEQRRLRGFRAFLGRYPFFSMFADLFPAELWADETVGDDSMMLPYIFAGMQNADFDGDHEVAFMPVLDEDQKTLFDNSKEILEDAGRIQLYNKLASEQLEKVKGNTPVFKKNASAAVPKIDFDYAAAIATRVQKPLVGLFSNMNEEFKKMVTAAGLGDLSALGNTGASDEEKKMAIRATLVKVMFDAMEQDTISAKKLVNRLMAAKVDKAGIEAPTGEQLFTFYNEAVKDLTSIIDDMRSGKADPEEIISRLANMGVFDVDDKKAAFLSSRETKNTFSIIESLPGGTEILKEVIPEYKPFAEAQNLEEQAAWGGVHGKDIVNAMGPLAKYLQSKGNYTGPATAAGLLQATSRHEYTPEKRSASVYNMVDKRPANAIQKRFYDLLKKENEMLDSADEAAGATAAATAGGGAGGSSSSSGGGSDDGGPANLATIIAALNDLNVKDFFAVPTTSITRNLYPFNNLENNNFPDDQTIKTVFGSYDEKKNKYGENLGFASRKEMLANIKNGAEPVALVGHVTGPGLQFYRTMSRVLKNRKGAPKITSVKKMMKYVRDNHDQLTEEAKNDIHIAEALFYLTEFDKNADLYEKYMRGVHGARGLNNAKAYLASIGESNFISGLENQIEAGAQSYDKFIESFGGKEYVTPINEVGFIGALDNKGSKKYKGRNDTLTLVQGKDLKFHLISVDDKHKSSTDGKITEYELAQQVMNFAAMKSEMAYAKRFAKDHEKDEGKGFNEWQSTPRAKNLLRDLVKENGKYANYSPKQLYDMLTLANDAQQYVEVLTPEGAGYFQINPNNELIGQILEEIKLRREGKTDGKRLSELLRTAINPISVPGTKVFVQKKKGDNPFLGMNQQKQANYYVENLKNLHNAKLEKAKAEYQANMAQYEKGLSEDEKKKWQDQVNEQSEKVKSLTTIIKKAEGILPKGVQKEALGGNKKEDLYPELKKKGEKGYVDIKSSQEYLDWEKEQKAAKAKRYEELQKTIYENQAGIDRRKRERGNLGDKISEDQSNLFAEQDAAANLAIKAANREIDATDWKAIVGKEEIRAIEVRYKALGAASNQKEAIAAAELLNKQLQERADILERIKEIDYELEPLDKDDPTRENLELKKRVYDKKQKELEANINYLKEQAKVTKKDKKGKVNKVYIGPNKDDEKLLELKADEKYNDYVAQKKKDALDDYNKTRKRINDIDDTITKGDIAASNADVSTEDAKAWEKTRESLADERKKLSEKSDSPNWDKKIDPIDLAMARTNANDAETKAAEKRQKEINNAYKAIIKERQILAENLKKVTYLLEHPDDGASEDVQKARQKVIDDINEKIEKNNVTAHNLEEKFGINANDFETKSAPEQVKQELKENADELQKNTEEAIKEEQQKQLAKYEILQKRRIVLAEQMKRRRIANEAKGTSQSQVEANLLLNELDQEEMNEIDDKLTSVDWAENVGGAGVLAKANKKIAASAAQSDANIAAYNKEIFPSPFNQLKNSVKGWFNQLMRGQLVWKIMGQVQRALRTVMEDAKKLDAILVNLQIVTGDTRENTRSLISTYASLGQTLSATTSEVASAANDWLRQGYSVSESIDLITASLQLSKLGMIDSGKATSYLTSMLKGFKLEASDATTVVDKLTKVDMSAATSAGDIAEALRQFATTAQLSGIDLDESIAMATTIMDVSQKDASSTGNAIKTMLSRYGNVKAGTYSGMNITGDQNETTESLNDIDKVLKKLGISLRSSNLEFRDFDDVLDDIAAKWDTLDSVSKNAIATAMAGTRQRESFLVLMENYDKYRDFIEEAANAEGTAAEKYKDYEDSLEASQKKLAAAWEELASKTEVVDFFKQVNKIMAALVKSLPLIARTFVRMFSGKAAANALNILQRSGSFSLSGFGKKVKSLFDPTYGLYGEKTGRTGLIDSQIRKGTSPILTELRKITHYVGGFSSAKTASGLNKVAEAGTAGAEKSPEGVSGGSYVASSKYALMTLEDAEKQRKLDHAASVFSARKKGIEDKEKELKRNLEEIKRDEEDIVTGKNVTKRAVGDGFVMLSPKQMLKAKKAKYKKDKKNLSKQKRAFKKDYSRKNLEIRDREEKLKQDFEEIKKERENPSLDNVSSLVTREKSYKKDQRSLSRLKRFYPFIVAKRTINDSAKKTINYFKTRKKLYVDNYSGFTEEEVFADTNLTNRQKKKAINAIKFDKDISSNKEKIKSLKQTETSLKSDKSREAELKTIKEQRKELAKESRALKRKKRGYRWSPYGYKKDKYVAAHTIDPELEDGTKLSDIKQNKDGTYSAKGHKGKISKKEYDKLKRLREESKEEAGKEFDAKVGKKIATRAVAAVAAGITGFMSAETRNTHKNRFTGEYETNETTNENVKGMMKANTGILTAIGTFFGGEAGGAIGGVIGDAFNRYVLGNIVPSIRDENLKNDRFGQVDKKKKQVEGAKSSITSVVELGSKETLTADDYSSLVKAQNELRDFMTKSENAGFKDEFVAYANKFLAGQSEGNEYAAKSFDELTNIADMTDAQRKKTAYALKVAQTKQENLAETAEYEKEMDSLNTDLGNDYLDVSGYNKRAKIKTWSLIGSSGISGYITAKILNEVDRAATLKSWNNKSIDEQIGLLEDMKAQGKGDSVKLAAMISKLQNINDTIKKIRDKVDQQRVEEGILEMSIGKNADGTDKTLLDLSPNALKDMGTDAIVEKMATYLQDRFGGMADGSSLFYTDENGNKQVTAAARKFILKGLKSNEDIYGAISGQNHRLSDVLGMKDGITKTEMLNNFANALHVSVDELQGLGTTFGNFTLGDLNAGAEALSSKFSDIQTAITNIASGSQSWATTLQSVAKTYPELLGYASDEYTLSLAMFQKMSDYKKLQTDAQMADIMANELYFDTFSDKLKDTLSDKEWEDFRNAQINSFNDLQQYIANNDTDLSKKLNEAAQAELKKIKLQSSEERQALEKVVSIKNAQIDKEINNLTSQKEAMQNINSQREYENKLIEAKLKLENASKEKKRIWREGVGWVYEEDQSAISEAKNNLDSVTNEKKISAITKQIDQLNADKNYLSSILSDQEEAVQKGFLQAYKDANGVTSDNINSLGTTIEDALNNSSEQANEKWNEWLEEYRKKEDSARETLKKQYDALQRAKKTMSDTNLSDEERAKAQENYNTALSNYQTTYNEGLSKGYWKESDFNKGGSMYETFGGENDAAAAGAGKSGYKQARPDQFIYQKDDSGNWNKFVFNPGNPKLLNSTEWNKFYNGKVSSDFYNKQFGESNHKLYVGESSEDFTAQTIYNEAYKTTTSNGFAKWLEDNFNGPTLVRIGQSGQWTRFIGGFAYKLDDPERVPEDEVPEDVKKAGGSFKEGSIDISKGNKIPLLMNEEGSEAIVTPSGTITALPAHSGIVPADVTTNLWNLGNYAPDLLRALQRQSLLSMGISGTAADNSVDNSVNINTVQMTVDADGGFNVDSFVQQLQQVAALTRNNRH